MCIRDSTEIAQKDDLGTLIQQHAAGDTLSITVAREGQMQTVSLTPVSYTHLFVFVQPLRHCYAMPPLLVGEALAKRESFTQCPGLPY